MNHAEQVFYTHLTDVDSLDVMAQERFTLADVREVIPTELGRQITAWALDYYFANGRKVAPSAEAIQETWGQQMEQAELSLGDGTETDSVEWSIQQLRINYAQFRSQQFVADLAKSVAHADPLEKVKAVQDGAYELFRISQSLTSHRLEMRGAEGVQAALDAYDERLAADTVVQGMTFGWPLLDDRIHGVHPGEIAVVAAGSGVGKSWVAIHTLYSQWKAGRRCVLFSLELTLETVFERMACVAKGVSYENWQSGQVSEYDRTRITDFILELEKSESQPVVVMPPRGDRSMYSLVRQAQSYDAETIIIDQLTFVDQVEGSRSRQRWESVGEKMHQLAELITSGTYRPSVLLMHQINRKGIEEAQKTGRYLMDHLAEGAEIERTASFVFAFFQSEMDKRTERARLQMLKARRVKCSDFDMLWKLEYGMVRILNEVISVDG